MEFDDDLPKSDLWLGGTSQLEDNYSDYLGDSLLNSAFHRLSPKIAGF